MSVPVLIFTLMGTQFFIMGTLGIISPIRITAQFGIRELDVDGRNEVRAVYGGFGLAIAGLLLCGVFAPELRAGISLTVAIALSGMAAGRLLSVLMDSHFGRMPAFYFAIEAIGAALLFWALRLAQ